MNYSHRDRRAFDIFALLLVGVGILFIAAGSLKFLSMPTVQATLTSKEKIAGLKLASATTVQIPNWPALRIVILGVVFVALGAAMNLGLKRLPKGPEAPSIS